MKQFAFDPCQLMSPGWLLDLEVQNLFPNPEKSWWCFHGSQLVICPLCIELYFFTQCLHTNLNLILTETIDRRSALPGHPTMLLRGGVIHLK